MVVWAAALSLMVPWLETRTGRDFPDSAVVALGLIVVGFLVGGYPRGLFRLWNGVFICFMLLVGWYLIRLGAAADSERGWQRVEPLLTSAMVVGMVFAAWAQPVRRRITARWLEIAAVLCFMLVVVQGADISSGRLQVADVNSIWVGRFAMLLGLAVVLGNGLHRGMRWGAFLIALIIAAFSGSRGPAVAGVLALIIAGLVQFRAARGRAMLAGGVLAAGAVAVALVVILLVQVMPLKGALPGPIARFGALISLDAAGLAGEESVTERLYMQRIAAGAFEEAPLIGRGPGHLWISSSFRYPHNMPLEIAAEVGLVGLALFGVLAALALRASRHEVWLAATLTLAIFGSLLSGDIGGNAMVFWLALIAGARGRWEIVWRKRARRLRQSKPFVIE
jgi:O-antigen ligase